MEKTLRKKWTNFFNQTRHTTFTLIDFLLHRSFSLNLWKGKGEKMYHNPLPIFYPIISRRIVYHTEMMQIFSVFLKKYAFCFLLVNIPILLLSTRASAMALLRHFRLVTKQQHPHSCMEIIAWVGVSFFLLFFCLHLFLFVFR